MKKWFVLLLGLFLIGGVFAVVPGEVTGAEEVEKITGIVEDLGPGADGNIDYGKYKPYATKAEVRIAAINLWLDENVGWMRYIFHMKPAVSWLFFINVYVILWFFVLLFLNAKGLWFFIEEEGKARIFGGALFFVFLVVKLYYGLASVIYNWIYYFLFVLLPTGIMSLLIGIVIVGVIGFFCFPFITGIMTALARYKEARDAAKLKMETEMNNEAMTALIEQVGDSN